MVARPSMHAYYMRAHVQGVPRVCTDASRKPARLFPERTGASALRESLRLARDSALNSATRFSELNGGRPNCAKSQNASRRS